VIKRISLLLAAAMLVATMAMAGLAAPVFADPDCSKVEGNNKNCETTVVGPSESENSQGAAAEKNKNIKTERTFKDRPQ
jgi:hypothetical protein